MAKYVYERWDYMPDLSGYLVKESSSTYLDDHVKLLSKNGDLSGTASTIRKMKVGEICIFEGPGYTNWDSGFRTSINKKTGANLYDQYKITKSDFIASLHPTVLIDEIIAEEGTYPDNGIQGDYWYIKTRKAFPDIHIKINGELRKAQSAWVKVGGVLKEVQGIYIKKDGQLKKGV